MNTGPILLVDDEATLAGLMRKYLSRLGYQVNTCEYGEQAWNLFSKEKQKYALVIVDLRLPDIPGETLLERMLEQNPNLRALACSGSPPSDTLAANTRIRFLQKPFLPKKLAEEVAFLLG